MWTFLRRYRIRTSKYQKREPTSFNKLDDSDRLVLRIKSWIYESATEFPPCSYRIFIPWARAVPLQTFITRYSNRKLSIVVALSTNFTQYAPETTKFGEIMQNKGHFAVQGQSTSPILAPIESSYSTSCQWLILTYLLSCTVREI